MKGTKLISATIVALGMALGSVAYAAPLTESANSFDFGWSFDTGAGYSLTGSGTITVSGFNSDTLTVTVGLTNTAPNASDRLTAFGFGIEPNASGVTLVSSDVFVGAYIPGPGNPSLPGDLMGIELCAYSGSNCAGGGAGGMPGGGTTSSTVLALAGTWGSSVIIDPFAVRYQTDVGSFVFFTNGNGNGKVPEPATLALFGAGLLGLALIRRRRMT